jgi:hypothetical protein
MDLTTAPKDEIHARREAYAASFDCDLDRIFEDLRAKEAQNPATRANVPPVPRRPPRG